MKKHSSKITFVISLLLLVNNLLQYTHASITLIGARNRSYQTINEKRFGNKLSLGVEYIARLQFLGKYSGGESDGGIRDESGGDDGVVDSYESLEDVSDTDDAYFCSLNSTEALSKKLVVPKDGLPGKLSIYKMFHFITLHLIVSK